VQTDKIGFSSSVKTSLYGGGRSVVGNTTIAFCGAVLMAAMVGGAFLYAGHPDSALLGIGMLLLAYFIFFFGTWHNVGKNPDPAVTSEEQYVRVTEVRHMAARDRSIVDASPPVLGSAASMIGTVLLPTERDDNG
jgi:hypothetical protein